MSCVHMRAYRESNGRSAGLIRAANAAPTLGVQDIIQTHANVMPYTKATVGSFRFPACAAVVIWSWA